MRRLHFFEPEEQGTQRAVLQRVLAAYPTRARVYGNLRFRFIPPAFLDAVEQHLPNEGAVLDLGCGYGMFALYYALRRPGCQFVAVDLDVARIVTARSAARALGAANVEFFDRDLAAAPLARRARAAYCIDILHHLPPEASERLIRTVFDNLEPGGVFVVKDLTTRPRPFLWWAYLQDTLMYPRDHLSYRSAAGWRSVLEEVGFVGVRWYPIGNFAPYPHFIAVAVKPHA